MPPRASSVHHFDERNATRQSRYPTFWAPAIGLTTFFLTISSACWWHFACPANLPVLSHAAEHSPEYYIFAIGMNWTAYYMYLSTQRFSNVLRRRLTKHRELLPRVHDGVAVVTTAALVVLSICDSIRFPDVHVVSTIVFFVFAWVLIALVHIGRHSLVPSEGAPSTSPDDLARSGAWLIGVGMASSLTFGYVYLARRQLAPDPLAFGVAVESSSELVAVVCQLLYMGTLPMDSVDVGDSVKLSPKPKAPKRSD